MLRFIASCFRTLLGLLWSTVCCSYALVTIFIKPVCCNLCTHDDWKQYGARTCFASLEIPKSTSRLNQAKQHLTNGQAKPFLLPTTEANWTSMLRLQPSPIPLSTCPKRACARCRFSDCSTSGLEPYSSPLESNSSQAISGPVNFYLETRHLGHCIPGRHYRSKDAEMLACQSVRFPLGCKVPLSDHSGCTFTAPARRFPKEWLLRRKNSPSKVRFRRSSITPPAGG